MQPYIWLYGIYKNGQQVKKLNCFVYLYHLPFKKWSKKYINIILALTRLSNNKRKSKFALKIWKYSILDIT